MEKASKIILNQALDLPANERAILAEQILLSLDLPDAELDELWAVQAERRIDEYEKGNVKTKSAQEVLGKSQQK